MGTYVIGDIHGCYKEWNKFRDKIEQQDNNATFILVGDIIDRGPDTLKMIQWGIDNITDNGKYQMVIGNHEDEKIAWWKQNVAYTILENITAKSVDYNKVFENRSADRYCFDENFKHLENPGDIMQEVIKWFETLPYYKDITIGGQRFIIAHANIPYSIIDETTYSLKTELKNKDKEFIVWDRDISAFDKKIPNAILVNGHTPTITSLAFETNEEYINNAGKIYHNANRYNIDCGLVFRERHIKSNLAALRLDDLKEFYLYNN